MNIIDIIIVAALALSSILGFRDGVIRQLGSLAAIIVAVLFARTFGDDVAAGLAIKGDYAHIWGFVIVLLISMIGVGFIATLLRKIVSAVGLGALDRLAGALLGFIKGLLLLSIALALFNFINTAVQIVEPQTTKSSKLYEPIIATSGYIIPAYGWIEQQIPHQIIKE